MGWKVEGATSFRPNVVSFTITAGQKLRYVVGVYVPPNDQPALHRVVQALARGPVGVKKLLFGYLYAYLAQPRDQREEDLTTAIADHGLSYQSQHLIPRRRYRGEVGYPWRMWGGKRPISE